MAITTVSRNKCFGGVPGVYSHESRETGSVMRFGVLTIPGIRRSSIGSIVT